MNVNKIAENQNSAPSYAQALATNLKIAATPKKVEARTYSCNMLTLRYVFKAGKVAVFMTKDGITSEYTTNIAHEIEELDAEIEMNHPNISVKVMTAVPVIEPVEALRAKHFAEFQAIMDKQNGRKGDGGHSVQGPLNVLNSDTVAPGAASSNESVGLKISVGSKA